MAKRQYTEDDKAVVLANYTANGGNLSATAKFCQIPINTIRRWINGEGVNENVVAKATGKKAELATLFENEARAALLAASQIRDGASYQQLMTAAAIGVDKMRLLREDAAIENGNKAEEQTIRVIYENYTPADPT